MPATHVDFQITRTTKTLLAHIALVRFLVRVRTHVYGQLGWISKHLLANIALVLLGFLSLHSFSRRRRHFFSYLLLLEDFKNDFILVRNLQTQHRLFFLFFFCSRIQTRHLQNRPRVHRSFRMWILSSSSHYYSLIHNIITTTRTVV